MTNTKELAQKTAGTHLNNALYTIKPQFRNNLMDRELKLVEANLQNPPAN